MKITIELPDTTICAFVNYINYSATGMEMGVQSIDSEDLEKARKQDESE